MKAIAKVTSGSLFCLLALGIGTWAEARALQEAPPVKNPGAAQGAGTAQTPGRGGERRPSVFGKLTAVHDQSVEVTNQSGDTVTVKISGSTQFRKEGEAAKLSDFKVGDIVFVRGEESPDHTWTAEIIGTRLNGGFGGGTGGGAQGGRGGPGGGSGGGGPAGGVWQDYVFGGVEGDGGP